MAGLLLFTSKPPLSGLTRICRRNWFIHRKWPKNQFIYNFSLLLSCYQLLEFLYSSSSGQNREFYSTLKEEYLNSNDFLPITKPNDNDLNLTPPPGCSWILADKGFGIILLPLDFVFQQEIIIVKKTWWL